MINGITHISMKCRGEEGLKKVLAFYVDLLGMKVVRKWDEGLMIETGNCQLEIFTNLEGNPETGIIRHIALDVDDSAFYAEKCRGNKIQWRKIFHSSAKCNSACGCRSFLWLHQ